MTLTTKDSADPASPNQPETQAPNPENRSVQNPRSNPVCLEVGVKIRSLPTESGGPFQPIREEGRTVIVFDNGAVLRSTMNLPPGQKVILSNASGRDVTCRIVGARNLPSVKGYVEVEFIEPVEDFWRIHQQGQSGAVVAPSPAAPTPPMVAAEPIAPATVRLEPTARVVAEKPAVASTGSGPSFDDVAGLVSPPSRPTGRDQRMEPARPGRDSQPKTEPVQALADANGSAVPPAVQWSRAESRSRKAEVLEAGETESRDRRSQALSRDLTDQSMLASTQGSDSSSATLTGGMPLRIAGAALLLAAIGGVMYFVQRGQTPAPTAEGSVAKQPSVAEPAALAKNRESGSGTSVTAQVPTQAVQAQPAVVAHADPVASIAPAPAVVSSAVAKELPSAQRQEKGAQDKATQDKATDTGKTAGASPARGQAIPTLKMKSPSAPKQNLGNPGEPPAPVAEIAPPIGAGGSSPNGLLSAVVRSSNQPAPPPSSFAELPANVNRDAKLISAAHAVYPQAAKVANVQGSVVVLAKIDPNGNVVDVIAESGPMLLRQAALESVRRWKYSPAVADGKPVATQIAVTVDFKLN